MGSHKPPVDLYPFGEGSGVGLYRTSTVRRPRRTKPFPPDCRNGTNLPSRTSLRSSSPRVRRYLTPSGSTSSRERDDHRGVDSLSRNLSFTFVVLCSFCICLLSCTIMYRSVNCTTNDEELVSQEVKVDWVSGNPVVGTESSTKRLRKGTKVGGTRHQVGVDTR